MNEILNSILKLSRQESLDKSESIYFSNKFLMTKLTISACQVY